MAKETKKHRLNVNIREKTYYDLKKFCDENELITTNLAMGTIVEVGLDLFFEEIRKRPLEDIITTYLNK